jgi:hypothetical protein
MRSGRDLVENRPDAIQMRWATLLHLEQQFPQEADYSPIIFFASQILQEELETLVLTPARAIAARLIANMDADRANSPLADLLRSWASEELPSTLGTASVVFLALRRGCERGDPRVEEFLATCFGPPARDLFMSRGMPGALDAIRRRFRNPVAHGTATFSAAEYEQFARLLVGNRRFAAWFADGPEPAVPGPEEAFLHHLLRQSSGRPPGQSQ